MADGDKCDCADVAMQNMPRKVFLRVGLLVARESLAALFDDKQPDVAAAIRAHWWDLFDRDPGHPRLFVWDELVVESVDGAYTPKPISAAVEALPHAKALLDLLSRGIVLPAADNKSGG